MRARVRRHVTRAGVVLAVTTLGVTALGPLAAAAAGDSSRAEGRFVDGTLAGQPFSAVAELKPAVAERKGEEKAVVSANEFSGSLGGQTLSAPGSGGITIPLEDLITLGVGNQYASASPRAASRAASGAVSDSGVVNTAKSDRFPASVQFSLGSLLDRDELPEQLRDQIGLDVELRGLAAVAAHDAERGADLSATCENLSDPAQCRDYDLATAEATLTIPAIGDALRQVLDAIEAGTIDKASCAALADGTPQQVRDTSTMLAGAAAQSPVKVRPVGFSVQDALDDVTTNASGEGVRVDLRDGTVTIDLAKVVERATGRAINDLPPNTDLAPYLAEALAEGPALLSSSLVDALGAVNDQLARGGVEITVGDQKQVLTGEQASAALEPIIRPLTQAIADGGKTLTDQLEPLADQVGAFEQLGSLVVNVQEEPSAGVYREVALRGTLLPGTPAEARLDLAAATVGPNTLGATGEGQGVPATPVGDPQGPGLPNTGASTLDLPFLLLGLAFVTGGLWVVMWGRAPVLDAAPSGPRTRRS